MADQDSTNQGNGSGEAGNEPAVATLAQYIKDLSVENPSFSLIDFVLASLAKAASGTRWRSSRDR